MNNIRHAADGTSDTDPPASIHTSLREGAMPTREGVPFAALRHRDFRADFLGDMLSMMADNIEHVISYWVIFQLFHSPALAGFAVISHWMPHLLLSWYFGGLSDRFDCRRVIQTSQALYMTVTWAWAIFIITDSLQMWHAMILLVFHGLAGTLWSPARQLLIHEIVGPAHLQSAVRLNATGRQLGILLGPAVGGALMLILGSSLGLIVNAFLYLPLIIWLQRVPYTGHRDRTVKSRKLSWKEMLGALRDAKGSHVIVSMVLLAGLSSLLVGTAFQAQMPEFAQDLGTDNEGFGYSALLTANGAGALVGGLMLESGGLLRVRARTAIILAIVWAIALGMFAAASHYPLALSLLFIAGVCNLAFRSMAQTLVQLLAPPNVRGRLIGLFIMSSQGLRTFSGVTVGLLGSYLGIHWSLGLSTGVLLVIILGLLTFTTRNYEE